MSLTLKSSTDVAFSLGLSCARPMPATSSTPTAGRTQRTKRVMDAVSGGQQTLNIAGFMMARPARKSRASRPGRSLVEEPAPLQPGRAQAGPRLERLVGGDFVAGPPGAEAEAVL